MGGNKKTNIDAGSVGTDTNLCLFQLISIKRQNKYLGFVDNILNKGGCT